MRKVFIAIDLKRVIAYFAAAVFIIILLASIFIFIGKKTEARSLSKGSGIEKYNIKPNDVSLNSSSDGPIVKVYISQNDKVTEMHLEEYVRGVVCAEMPATFDIEALKAQAVAARTFAFAHMKMQGGNPCKNAKGGDLCDTVHCQVYKDKETRLSSWNEKYRGEYWNKITQAVQETTGEILTYNGELVKEAYYFAVSSGRTENGIDAFATDAPYLKSVVSTGEEEAQNYKSTINVTYSNIAAALNKLYPKAGLSATKLKNQIKVTARNEETNSVKEIKVGSITISGTQFRQLFGLKSANFKITKVNSKDIEIECTGYGHGVGMSQWGANAMAKAGKTYKQILTHYYQGVKVEKLNIK